VAALAPDLRWDFPLRLLGGLHYLVLAGEGSWDDVDAMLDERGEFLARFAAEQPVQTNEVARAWALLPGLLSLGEREIDLLELGASAGLLSCLDRYGYRYGSGRWGSGRPVLEGETALPDGLLDGRLNIVSRRGIDRHPIDVTDNESVRLLEAFIWPDQTERRERLHEAIAVAREDPPELVQGDYVELAPTLVGEHTVVISAVTTLYLDDERHAELMERLRGVTWLSLEPPRHDREYDGMRLELDGRVLAEHVDFHGFDMEWVA
jgi:hypothetical protein